MAVMMCESFSLADFYIGCLKRHPNSLSEYLAACQTNETDTKAMAIWNLKAYYLHSA